MGKIKVEVPIGESVSATVAVCFLVGGDVDVVAGESSGGYAVIEDDGAATDYSDYEAARSVATSCGGTLLATEDPALNAEVIEYCTLATSTSVPESELLEKINARLWTRSFLVGYSITLADVFMWTRISKSGAPVKAVNLARWFSHVERLPAIEKSKAFLTEHSGTAGDWAEVMRLVKSQGNFHVFNLPGVEPGKVCTRFPPEPSGYLHIGHAKAALLNDFLARSYNGKLILRFDDTNPTKEKSEFEENIMADLERLGIKPDTLEYTSDYFDKLLEMATDWIKQGNAYVDKTPVEEMRRQRMACEENEYRKAPVEDNLKLWEEMKKGSEIGLTCCVRAKIDMQSKNGTMRDPIIYRCIEGAVHHRTGTKYKLYPSYDFSCPIVDSLEGVTHALRSNEYIDREVRLQVQYYWMCDTAKLRRPYMWDFSRLNFKYAVLSKRKLQWFVDNKIVEGWADPRFPTVQGIRRRGMTIQALRAFILSQGASKNTNLMEWDKIWTVNKRVIDPVAPRHTAIGKANRVLVVNNGIDEVRTVQKHKKNPDLGKKNVIYAKRVLLEEQDVKGVKEGEIVTLMDWGNVQITSVSGEELHGEFLPNNKDFRKTQKFTWLAEIPDLAPATLVTYRHLITKEKLEEDEKLEDFVNTESKIEEQVVCDVNVKLLQEGEVIQFERRGYYILDAVFRGMSDRPMVFIQVPDGREGST